VNTRAKGQLRRRSLLAAIHPSIAPLNTCAAEPPFLQMPAVIGFVAHVFSGENGNELRQRNVDDALDHDVVVTNVVDAPSALFLKAQTSPDRKSVV
jgi:hypothetical protein